MGASVEVTGFLTKILKKKNKRKKKRKPPPTTAKTRV